MTPETYGEVTYGEVTAAAGHVPHPDSRLDRTQRAAAQEAPVASVPADVDEPAYVVPVRPSVPEECVPRTLLLGANNPYLPVLPRDMRRRRVILIAVDNDVVLCETKELAQAVATLVAGGTTAAALTTGGYLPKGIPVPLESRSWMYVAATTTASTSRVTVIAERYADLAP